MKKTSLLSSLSSLLIFFTIFISLNSCNKPAEDGYDYSLIPVQSDFWGYIDISGKFIINPQFREAYYFTDGLALAKAKDDKYGFIDKTGKWVIKPIYKYATSFSEGLACVTEENSFPIFINKKGGLEFMVKNVDAVSSFNNGMAKILVDGKYGFINKKGIVVVNPQFLNSLNFKDDFAAVSIVKGITTDNEKESWGYITKDGKYLINPQFVEAYDFSDDLALVKVGSKYGYIDREGKLQINPQFDYAYGFSEGLAAISLDGSYGYIDKKGSIEINPQFSAAESFHNGLASVKSAIRSGYIDKSGKYSINPQFNGADDFNSEFAIVNDDSKYGLVDKNGKFIVTPQFSDMLDNSELSDHKNKLIKSDYLNTSQALTELESFLTKQTVLNKKTISVEDIGNIYSNATATSFAITSSINLKIIPQIIIEDIKFNFDYDNYVYYGGGYDNQMLLDISNKNDSSIANSAEIKLNWTNTDVTMSDKMPSFAGLVADLIGKKYKSQITKEKPDCGNYTGPCNTPYKISTKEIDFEISYEDFGTTITLMFKNLPVKYYPVEETE